MRAQALLRAGAGRVEEIELDPPTSAAGEVLLRVLACGVCRTDLHIVDGELATQNLPLIPGHEIVARVEALGRDVDAIRVGDRVGVPWLAWTCGLCVYCASGRENLCEKARFTGYQTAGGYAQFAIADWRYCFPLPPQYGDAECAPLLCAGLIGFRAYRVAGEGRRLGLYGFGAAAHILVQLARAEGREVYAFTRRGDTAAQRLAVELGAAWSGASDEAPPRPLDAAILFAPDGALIPAALTHTVAGGAVVCAGIHMSDIPSFPYQLLWRERTLRSVANLTRKDAREFLALAPRVPIRTRVQTYPLDAANRALADLREGRVSGAAVLLPHG